MNIVASASASAYGADHELLVLLAAAAEVAADRGAAGICYVRVRGRQQQRLQLGRGRMQIVKVFEIIVIQGNELAAEGRKDEAMETHT